VRVTLILGFLGAGKTTLLARLLDAPPAGERLAVLVNEFGDVGVDGAVLAREAIELVEVPSGCICCSLRGALGDAVRALEAAAAPDRLVIEASGVAVPGDLLAALADLEAAGLVEPPGVATVVDVARLEAMLAGLGPFYRDQIACADLIVANKIDRAQPPALDRARAALRAINPAAAILFAEQCDIELAELPAAPRAARAAAGQAHGHDAGLDSFVVALDRPLARAALAALFAAPPPGLWRAKGFAVTEEGPVLVQYDGTALALEPAPPRASYALVFIGRDLDPDTVRRALGGSPPGGHPL